jgi:hypothetical protein
MDFLNLARALDPVLLMRDAGFEPDPWQRRVLLSESRRMMICASRQSGKSTVVACLALHKYLFTQKSLVLLTSPVERQSQELYIKIMEIYEKLDRPVPPLKEPTSEGLVLENGSRIVVLPGHNPDNLRSYSSVSMAVIDEAARVKAEMFTAISPMMAISRGRFLLLTTPKGRRGVFYDLWTSSDSSWERIQARASECPRYDPEFLESERRLFGEAHYLQEYESEFITDEDQVFSAESIDAIFDTDEEAIRLPGSPGILPGSRW